LPLLPQGLRAMSLHCRVVVGEGETVSEPMITEIESQRGHGFEELLDLSVETVASGMYRDENRLACCCCAFT
jgi:hypothetical protein